MNNIVQLKKNLSQYDNYYVDKSPIYLKTKAQKCAKRGKSERVKGFYSPPCALSIKHS